MWTARNGDGRGLGIIAGKIMNKNGAEKPGLAGTKGQAGEGPWSAEELRDAITEQHKEERGQLKDLRVTAFVSVVIPLHCQRPSLRVLSWPEINGAFI